MLDSIDTVYIKNKFATLCSKLYTNAKIDYSEIYDKLLFCDFLDCFENNDIRFYLSSSYEGIIYLLFKKEMVFEEELNSVIYWCGLQYMNIFLNRRVPLKQVLCIIPFNDMINLYDTYHEMSEIQLVEYYDQKYKENSILKFIRNKRNITVKELCYLTGINEATIKYYEKSNNNLLNASYENIKKISFCLEVSSSIFNKHTDFCVYTLNLIKNEEWYKLVCDYLKNYYHLDDEIIVYSGVWYFDAKRKVFVDDVVLKCAINDAFDKYKDTKLLF